MGTHTRVSNIKSNGVRHENKSIMYYKYYVSFFEVHLQFLLDLIGKFALLTDYYSRAHIHPENTYENINHKAMIILLRSRERK